jgi:hypothetical protein
VPLADETKRGNKSGRHEVLIMRQRTLLQYLSLTDWQVISRLPVAPGEMTPSRLVQQGWIETRGEHKHAEIRLTPAGREAMRKRI